MLVYKHYFANEKNDLYYGNVSIGRITAIRNSRLIEYPITNVMVVCYSINRGISQFTIRYS